MNFKCKVNIIIIIPVTNLAFLRIFGLKNNHMENNFYQQE